MEYLLRQQGFPIITNMPKAQMKIIFKKIFKIFKIFILANLPYYHSTKSSFLSSIACVLWVILIVLCAIYCVLYELICGLCESVLRVRIQFCHLFKKARTIKQFDIITHMPVAHFAFGKRKCAQVSNVFSWTFIECFVNLFLGFV